jgi:hypothetical protein
MRIRVLLPLLVLLGGVAHGDPTAPFLDTGFGPRVADLRLAVTVDADGAAARFRIENVGKRRTTFTTEYSCSGLSPFSLGMGTTADSLDAVYAFEPKVNGLARKLETRCTRNGPRKRVTVAPGKTVAITVPFARKGEILASKQTAFQASADLDIEGRTGRVVLHSLVVTVSATTSGP